MFSFSTEPALKRGRTDRATCILPGCHNPRCLPHPYCSRRHAHEYHQQKHSLLKKPQDDFDQEQLDFAIARSLEEEASTTASSSSSSKQSVPLPPSSSQRSAAPPPPPPTPASHKRPPPYPKKSAGVPPPQPSANRASNASIQVTFPACLSRTLFAVARFHAGVPCFRRIR